MTIHTIEDATGYSHGQQEQDARDREDEIRVDDLITTLRVAANALSGYSDYVVDPTTGRRVANAAMRALVDVEAAIEKASQR